MTSYVASKFTCWSMADFLFTSLPEKQKTWVHAWMISSLFCLRFQIASIQGAELGCFSSTSPTLWSCHWCCWQRGGWNAGRVSENPEHRSWWIETSESTGDIGDIHCRLKGQHLPLDKTFEPGHEQDGSCSNGTWPSSCHLEWPSTCRSNYWHCLSDASCTCKIRCTSPVWCGLEKIQQQPTPLHCKNL